MVYQNDRRRAPRVSCDLSVEYGVRDDPTRVGRLTNIGTGGALLMTQAAGPPVGTVLLLRFHLPLSNRAVKTFGKVEWANLGRIGVQFVHLSLHEQEEIWRYYARESAWERDREP